MKNLAMLGDNKMKRLKIMMSTIFLVVFLAFGASVNAKSQGDTSFGLYSMMGGGSGGMMGGGGGMSDRYGNMPGTPRQYGNDPVPYGQHSQAYREEIDILKRKIIEKRKELSSLYQSDGADKDMINDKIGELNRLEQQLDDKLSDRR